MKKYVDKTDIINLDELRRELLEGKSKTPSIMVMNGDQVGKVIQLETFSEIYAGRDVENDIPLDLSGLSRRHCMFFRKGNVAFVKDLDSTNGTFVNGKRITEAQLKDGDRVFLADVYASKFTYTDESDLIVNRMLFEKATKDALTGINNRTYFMENLKKEFAFHKRAELPLTLLFFDLDDFKKVNDTHGHACGDRALKTIAATVKNSIREEDFLARYGGEEFLIFMKNTSNTDGAQKADILRELISNAPVKCNDKTIFITASFGVATFTDNNVASADELLILADTRMYEAKQQGKNRVVG